MSADEDFDAWALAVTPRLLRTARLLAADTHDGEDLLQDVLERVYVRWRSMQDPQSYARTVMTRAVTDR